MLMLKNDEIPRCNLTCRDNMIPGNNQISGVNQNLRDDQIQSKLCSAGVPQMIGFTGIF